MILLQFNPLKLAEYADPRVFQQQVSPLLVLREAENCYMLGLLPDLVANAGKPGHSARFFALRERDSLVAAAILVDGCLLLSWASHEMIRAIVDGLAPANPTITNVYAPAYVSWVFAEAWAQRTGQAFAFDRAERVYQLARVVYEPPATGRLELATPADHALLTSWFQGFGREARYENTQLAKIQETLVASGALYLWKNPAPVSMAAWVSPTPNGGCINFVYTPPEFRRRGHAKAVVAALGRHMLASGRRYCFILTEPTDNQTNVLYQQVGARTLCELLRCAIKPAAAASPLVIGPPPVVSAAAS